MKKDYTVGTGIFDKENMLFELKKDLWYTVKADTKLRVYREREDAGGGYYWTRSYIWTEARSIVYTVWDKDKLIGTIINGSSIKFKDSRRHQIKLIKENI